MGKRMQGRAGQEALARRRKMHPFCAHCAARGKTRAAVEMDHVTPLALGGEDVDGNIQGLCLPCHAVKTAFENASAGGAANHPEWLRPARCELVIVSGPPCAGKSYLVEQERGELDVVIDLDSIAEELSPGFNPVRRWNADLLNRSIRVRNAMLGSLSQLPDRSRAWFIVSAPTKAEREWWRYKLMPFAWRLIDPGDDVCMRRAQERNGPIAIEAVRRYRRAERQRWSSASAPRRRQAAGADGYPIVEAEA